MVNKRLMCIAIKDTLIGFLKVQLIFASVTACFALVIFLIMLTGIDFSLAVALGLFIGGVTGLLVLHAKDRYNDLLRCEERDKLSP